MERSRADDFVRHKVKAKLLTQPIPNGCSLPRTAPRRGYRADNDLDDGCASWASRQRQVTRREGDGAPPAPCRPVALSADAEGHGEPSTPGRGNRPRTSPSSGRARRRYLASTVSRTVASPSA